MSKTQIRHKTGRAIVRVLPSTAVPEFTNFRGRGGTRTTTTTGENENNRTQEVLTIHVQFQSEKDDKNTIEFQMNRDASEPSLLALRRLEVTARKKIMKLMKGEHATTTTATKAQQHKSSVSSSPIPEIIWTDDDTCMPSQEDLEQINGAQLWSRAGHVKFALPDISHDIHMLDLKVIYNPPTIQRVAALAKFHQNLYVGVPLALDYELWFAEDAFLTWFVNDDEKVQGIGASYTPVQEDVGKAVSVSVLPFRRRRRDEKCARNDNDDQNHDRYDGSDCDDCGEECTTFQFVQKVSALPYMPIVQSLRSEWISRTAGTRTPEHIRVLSYNLLASLYASKEKTYMYSYCKPEWLSKERRMPMLAAEILAYDADILCLQEVDYSVFTDFLRPMLYSKGYCGFYSNKISLQREGCAMFWRDDRFECTMEDTLAVRDLVKDDCGNDEWDSTIGVSNLLSSHKYLREIVEEKVGTICQIARLSLRRAPQQQQRNDSSCSTFPDQILVANTHLFYHPRADHVRAIQAFAICRKIDELRKKQSANCNNGDPFLLCGDLNSDPCAGAMQLLFARSLIPGLTDCWKHLDHYKWNEEESDEAGEDHTKSTDDVSMEPPTSSKNCRQDKIPALILPSSFPHLFSGCQGIPEFTNFVRGFQETLDYVLASQPAEDGSNVGFVPVSSVPMPSRNDILPYIAMPNEHMPSDHVAVVCDLKFDRIKV